ncbi:M14 family metallopeptidase [Brumimicrobium mesophilum]|uniref:succinylglutamate desuccinylase/aspartoacylase domain-containing protein n=1 Tax=Brumimicrobium mesophilum TaxID=392717 RepID=UPI000D142151|nr:succinylglutamate desuccinylase/aspartoacylase family protein [Brumimicrobium mesophilum]
MNLDKDHSRIIGEYTNGKDGPLLFISAGVHGNEPSGVLALQKVFEELNISKPKINGAVVGVLGNIKALEKKVRFIDEDLNRTWTKENITKQITDSSEKVEMFQIIELLKNYPLESYEKRYFLDCHTTSSDSLPYISVQNVNDNYQWAEHFPTHIIRGFSDIVYGCIDHYLSRTGLTGFVFEGGQHESKSAIMNHEGMIWLALKNACSLEFDELSNFPKAIDHLNQFKPQQKTFEILYRHGLKDEDNFAMLKGYTNFQKLKKGEILALQNGKEIISEWDDYIFMPFYQSQGNDGFFIIREVK